MSRPIDAKSQLDLVREWDKLAPIRYEQISDGRDITYNHVLVPRIRDLVCELRPLDVLLDAGCGVGVLTRILAAKFPRVVGIDPSVASIAIANAHCAGAATFRATSLENCAKDVEGQFDVVVANMVLMNVIDLNGFLVGAHRVLRPGGAMAFSITHPWFWPNYYGYADEPWFRYDLENIVEGPFRITNAQDEKLPSTHIHRALHVYFKAFVRVGFGVRALLEPMPSAEVAALYPSPWKYPRYIFGVAMRD